MCSQEVERSDRRNGLTLIELLISISISMIIAAALYFSMRTAIESWVVTEDQLVLQHILSNTMDEISEGLPETFGIRDALEVVDGRYDRITVVMPWTDDTHFVFTGIFKYQLNRHLKLGTGLPIAEVKLPNLAEYKIIPIRLTDPGRTEALPEAVLSINVPAGSRLRFTYFPDTKKEIDVTTTFRYDSALKSVLVENIDGVKTISQNPFGVKIMDLQFKYFDNTNTEIGANGSLSNADAALVTGVEIYMLAESRNGNTRQSKTFVSLRNAPTHSGNLTLKEEAHFPIPNSKEVRALFLTNLYGINDDDEIVLEARPQNGKDWRLNITFSRMAGQGPPLIESYSIEYPIGNKVFFDNPRTYASLGLNLLSLGSGGDYDYDDDGLDDSVILEGKVEFRVHRMDIAGASLFVKP